MDASKQEPVVSGETLQSCQCGSDGLQAVSGESARRMRSEPSSLGACGLWRDSEFNGDDEMARV